MINFSDDILLSCKPDDVARVEEIVQKQFKIAFEPVDRWVSMEFELSDDGITITTKDAAKGMCKDAGRFSMN